MNIQKCDICRKTLKDDTIRARFGFFQAKDFCFNCGKPVLDFLKKHKFISKENKKIR